MPTGEKSKMAEPTPDEPRPHPTGPSERIVALDSLRGFALLGILVINITLFSMPLAAANNPTVFGDFTGVNYAVWLGSYVFFELKFMTLFTLMFGAGIVLFTTSKERRGAPALTLHYRRMAILLLIGLAHAYLLWSGDILVAYGLCALVVVLARHWRPIRQVIVGTVLIAIPFLLYLSLAFAPEIPDTLVALWEPSEETIQSEIEAYRGGWSDQMDHRVPMSLVIHTQDFLSWRFWRLSGLMLLGMALFKWGVLSNERSERFYRQLLIGGGAVGLTLILVGVWYKTQHDWGLRQSFLIAEQFNYWGSIPLAFAYIAGMMLWCRHRVEGVITRAFTAVGRTAFSNYLLQTLLATSIFYGHGLGLFASVSRAEAVLVVGLIWVVQISLSVLWLQRFRFGPVEWIWRALTYGERPPLRRSVHDKSGSD